MKSSGEKAGIGASPLIPYPNEDGINIRILPPSLSNGIVSCQPAIVPAILIEVFAGAVTPQSVALESFPQNPFQQYMFSEYLEVFR